MERLSEWDLHNFPFSFYGKSKILFNYNVVPFLASHLKHNIGLFQRLCGCYHDVPWGHLNANLLAQFQAEQPNAEQMFAALGLPQETVGLFM
jgi:hypothetical protein